MTIDRSAEQLLSEAESSLAQVIRFLASGEQGALALGERRLIELLGTLGEIEGSVRRKPKMPIRGPLLAIRKTLAQGRELSSFALRTVERQMENRNFFPPARSTSLCVEG